MSRELKWTWGKRNRLSIYQQWPKVLFGGGCWFLDTSWGVHLDIFPFTFSFTRSQKTWKWLRAKSLFGPLLHDKYKGQLERKIHWKWDNWHIGFLYPYDGYTSKTFWISLGPLWICWTRWKTEEEKMEWNRRDMIAAQLDEFERFVKAWEEVEI